MFVCENIGVTCVVIAGGYKLLFLARGQIVCCSLQEDKGHTFLCTHTSSEARTRDNIIAPLPALPTDVPDPSNTQAPHICSYTPAPLSRAPLSVPVQAACPPSALVCTLARPCEEREGRDQIRVQGSGLGQEGWPSICTGSGFFRVFARVQG